MLRLFDEHSAREVTPLDGIWKFKTDKENVGERDGWYNGLCDFEKASVPSVWNTDLKLLGYEGAMWYEREFYFRGGNMRLNFGAVMTEARVWLDGEFLGSHYGGFTRFDFLLSDVDEGNHRLTVRVDNSFDKKSIPQVKVDWYHYGGIIRSVDAERLDGIVILGQHLEYLLDVGKRCAECRVRLEVYNSDAEERTSAVTTYLGEKIGYADELTLAPHERKEILSEPFLVENIRLWDIGEGNLYDLVTITERDDLCDRVGFRLVEVGREEILLNGRRVEIRGVNRHEEHPDWGFAFPHGLMKRDLDIAEELGCNSIRGSHYPMSKIFLDMLDERGILFWSEIPMWGWGFSVKTLADREVVQRGLDMHREMVSDYYNHPAIIIWGMHNEIHTEDPVAIPLSKKYYEYLKAEGGNRIVTFATDKPLEDLCLEYCDLISINAYHGWYSGGIDYWAEFLKLVRERRDSLGYGDKPVIFSEFGAAALYGYRTFDDIQWTEEYQARLLCHAIDLFHNDSMCSGFYIWQMNDIRTCIEAGINRARGFNNKGILNEYRRPKAAYFAVKELYNKYKDE